MGAGTSKGTVRIVTANTTLNTAKSQANNNNRSHFMNAEQQGQSSHAAAESENVENGGVMDIPITSDKFNVKTVANFKALEKLTKHQDSATQDGEPPPSSNVLLTSFSEKYPVVVETLKTIHGHYQALKTALDGANLSSKATLDQVKGLFSVYFKQKEPKNRNAVTEFAVALSVPKLAYEMIIDRRKNCPDLTTWDREEDEEENIQKIMEGSGNETVGGSAENQAHSNDKDKREALKMSQDVISQLLAAVLNFSDLYDQFGLVCFEIGMVRLLVDMTKDLQDAIPHNVKYVNAETQQLSQFTVRGKMLSRVLGILHNFSKRVPTRRSFADCQALDVLIPLLKAEVILYSTKSLLILAYLTDEENNHLIMADKGPIKFLTGLLKKALTMRNHRYQGFSASELAEGLAQIAVNDNNKKTIAQSGAVPILVTMLQNAQSDDERLNACKTLWTLAFDDENKQEIKNNQFAIAELQNLLSSENSELRRAAAGALWECQGKDRHAEKKRHSDAAQEATDTKHVMISYQWDVQKPMIQLKNQLQAHGYKVWMDVDEMGGSTLESMAKAVENASVVLLCVSQKYKESPNCRSEAEYTYQLHKDVIPLMMDYKYKPDGWLGIIVGSKFWIDFSEKHKLDSNVEKLTKELGNRGKIAAQETIQGVHKVGGSDVVSLAAVLCLVTQRSLRDETERLRERLGAMRRNEKRLERGEKEVSPATAVDLVDAAPQTSIRSWTNNDVRNWLKEGGLEGRVDSKALKRLDGRMLLRLQDLRKESPEFFYTSIRTDLKLDSVFDVLEFTDELDKLER